MACAKKAVRNGQTNIFGAHYQLVVAAVMHWNASGAAEGQAIDLPYEARKPDLTSLEQAVCKKFAGIKAKKRAALGPVNRSIQDRDCTLGAIPYFSATPSSTITHRMTVPQKAGHAAYWLLGVRVGAIGRLALE
jgi:hypothetical protein